MPSQVSEALARATRFLEQKRVMGILDANKGKDFVQRILSPKDYPVIQNPNGSVSSLLMSTATAEGKAYAFPLIFHENKQLIDMRKDWRKAFQHALKTGENIPFSSEKDALWFTNNYKKVW